MASIVKLKISISHYQLEWDLRSDFIDKIVKRKTSGSIVVLDDEDIAVVFNVGRDNVEIYARTRFFSQLFAGINVFCKGIIEDKKNKSKKKYLFWFNNKYKDCISS